MYASASVRCLTCDKESTCFWNFKYFLLGPH